MIVMLWVVDMESHDDAASSISKRNDTCDRLYWTMACALLRTHRCPGQLSWRLDRGAALGWGDQRSPALSAGHRLNPDCLAGAAGSSPCQLGQWRDSNPSLRMGQNSVLVEPSRRKDVMCTHVSSSHKVPVRWKRVLGHEVRKCSGDKGGNAPSPPWRHLLPCPTVPPAWMGPDTPKGNLGTRERHVRAL